MWELPGARAASVSVCVLCGPRECLYVSVKVCHCVCMELLAGVGVLCGDGMLAVLYACLGEPTPSPHKIKAKAGGSLQPLRGLLPWAHLGG